MKIVVKAVGLLLFDGLGRILLLEELVDKLHYSKSAGMVSFPIETIKTDESKEEALERLIFEEIGVTITPTPDFFGTLDVKVNEKYSGLISTYVGTCNESFESVPNDTDVKHFGWMFPINVLRRPPKEKRVEVDQILTEYLKALNGV